MMQWRSPLFAAYLAVAAAAPRQIPVDKFAFKNIPDTDKENAKANAALRIQEHEQGGYPLTCSTNLTIVLPACLQYEPDWCWATAVSEFGAFFDPTHIAARDNDCHGIECRVVSNDLDPFATGACCGSRTPQGTCGTTAGSAQSILRGINFLTNQNYLAIVGGPLPEPMLDYAMSMGYPVGIAVVWSNGNGGHMLTLGGCAGGGKYYIHDPLSQKGWYQTRDYKGLVHFYPGDTENAPYEIVAVAEDGVSLVDTERDNQVFGYWAYTFVLHTKHTAQGAEELLALKRGYSVVYDDVVDTNGKTQSFLESEARSAKIRRSNLRGDDRGGLEEDEGSFLQTGRQQPKEEAVQESTPRQISADKFPLQDVSQSDRDTGRANAATRLKEHDQGGYPLTCSTNLTNVLPGCLQYEPDWCWATAISEMSAFFDPTHIRSHNNDCHGIECRVVSHRLDPFATGVCCGTRTPQGTCARTAGSAAAIVQGLTFATNQNFLGIMGGPLPEPMLDEALSLGYPIGIGVMWSNGFGGHMLTLGGCAGHGKYYLHDPLSEKGWYQTRDYRGVVHFFPGNTENAPYEIVAVTNSTMEDGRVSLAETADSGCGRGCHRSRRSGVYGIWTYTFMLNTLETGNMVKELLAKQEGYRAFYHDMKQVGSENDASLAQSDVWSTKIRRNLRRDDDTEEGSFMQTGTHTKEAVSENVEL